MERRLSAVLSADVVGYSRLMGTNEVATLITRGDKVTFFARGGHSPRNIANLVLKKPRARLN